MKNNSNLCRRPFKLTMNSQREKSVSACDDVASVVLNKRASKLLRPLNLPDEATQSILNHIMLENSSNKSDIDRVDIDDTLYENYSPINYDTFERKKMIHQ